MRNTKADMELCEAILSMIEKKRTETGDDTIGAPIERLVMELQFRDLEREILDNPGAFEPWLIRRRRNET